MLPDSTKLPLPVLVRSKPVPDTTPDKVNCVPATLTELLAVMVTPPDKLLVPVEVAKVPPWSVMASAPTAAPRRSSVAPLATATPPAVVPKPLAWLMARVPALMVVAPV